ncbi:MAG TPA: DUF2914 domain-containing protein [Vicinamibacterales bacterium]|nr:DUF2914 domain-containing protein [Vicinamibacterales bacterium]
MPRPLPWRQRARGTYKRHRLAWDLAFFAGGFCFDVFAAQAGVDHLLMILQQTAYLSIIGGILYVDFMRDADPEARPMRPWVEKLWGYRSLVFHFCLGTLMNLYSIFFLMSASFFSSIVFVVVLFGAVILNEIASIRHHGFVVKAGLYVVSVFCFFSLLIPILIGRVGQATFIMSFLATLGVLALFYTRMRRRLRAGILIRRLLAPGLAVSALFLGLYLAGLIPPVPIAAKTLGIYHRVERVGDHFVVSYVPSFWQFWRKDDERFEAEPGDVVHVFFAIYSPTNFDDTVFVRWSLDEPGRGWQDSDRIPIRITGGRREGFRGYTAKQNYSAGNWRVLVETRDGREIARLHFTVTNREANPNRVFRTITY